MSAISAEKHQFGMEQLKSGQFLVGRDSPSIRSATATSRCRYYPILCPRHLISWFISFLLLSGYPLPLILAWFVLRSFLSFSNSVLVICLWGVSSIGWGLKKKWPGGAGGQRTRQPPPNRNSNDGAAYFDSKLSDESSHCLFTVLYLLDKSQPLFNSIFIYV